MITLEIIGRFLISRVGLLVMAAAGVLIFYEGVPQGPLRLIPGIHRVVWEGRVADAARKAREGYVQEARLIAAEGKATELERQLAAGRRANALYAELLAEAQEKERVDAAAEDQIVADYEKKLAAAGRSCLLDADDLGWLRK